MIGQFKKKQKAKQPKPKGNVARSLVGLLNGNILTREDAIQHLPFLLFLAFLALVYIANGYYAEGTVRTINKVDAELKEMRSEYITTKSYLMYKSKQSEVAKQVTRNELGLKETLVPPKKIVVKREEMEKE